MGFADLRNRIAWAQGTHEYRPMGTAAIALSGVFRHRHFRQGRACPAELRDCFAGFFGSLEEVNVRLRASRAWRLGRTPFLVR